MSTRHREPTTPDPQTELADLIHELVDDFDHNEPYTVLRLRSAIPDNRQAQEIRVHRTRQPSLLDQLALAVEPAVDPDAMRHGVASSQPSAHLDAIDRLVAIDRESRELIIEAGERPVLRTVDNVRRLPGLATTKPTAVQYVHTVRRWLIWAKTVSGWDSPPKRPNARCLVCDELGTLRARFMPTTICCIKCGSTWDDTNLGLLAAAMSGQGQKTTA